MIFDYLYKSNSAGDPGSLFQLKCKLNRKDVNEKVNKSYHGCESFFSTVLDGYVVYAAMEYFGMTTPDGIPSKNVPDRGGSNLFEKVGEMVDKFVLLQVQAEEVLLEDALQNEDGQGTAAGIQVVIKFIFREKGVITMSSMSMESEFKTRVQIEALQIQEMRMVYLITPITFLRRDSF